MEQEKAVACCANALIALRKHLKRPPSLFDRHEAIELLESLVRLARTQAHDKAEEYSAALDEVKARQASLESGHLQRLMLGLVGDPLRAKMAKEANSILKGSPGRNHLALTITALAVVCHLTRSSVTAVMVGAT